MFNPVSSYRIQFNKSFTLDDLGKYLDYLNKLGVGSIYASPVFAALPGSNHGYDVTSPNMINPELGTIDDLASLTQSIKETGMGWIQDIVPNHMAYHPENRWIWDILEKGADSEFSVMIDTEPQVTRGAEKIMLPFLGSDTDQAVHNLDLQVCLYRGSLALNYFDTTYPANFNSFRTVFTPYMNGAPDCLRLIWNRYDLAGRMADKAFLNKEWEVVKSEIDGFCKTDPEMQAFTGEILKKINNDPVKIMKFVSGQHYELCHWKEISRRINYRRFFTVGGLICMRMEDEKVMEQHHALLRELITGGHIQGLRVDHVDGLRNPSEYLERLRSMANGKSYIVVEKILEHGEKIPENWAVEGSSGYDFLGMVNSLLLKEKGYRKLQKFYRQFTGETDSPDNVIYKNKKLILTSYMQGELANLSLRFEPLLASAEKRGIAAFNENKGITKESVKAAIGEFMLSCPFYRLYPEEFPFGKEDKALTREMFRTAAKRNPGLKSSLGLISDIFLKDRKNDEEYDRLRNEFFGRLMQFTGPLTAKGVEDTSMYRYNSFIAGNEVGDSLHRRGMDPVIFHEAMEERLQKSPLSMNSTSTHDTKRGEDVRARLNVIGDMADEWIRLVREWKKVNAGLKKKIVRKSSGTPDTGKAEVVRSGLGKVEMVREVTGRKAVPGAADEDESTLTAPSANEEYFIYQTIAGTFPFNAKADIKYIARIREFLVKALREAKQNSNWEEPDEEYEKAVCDFAESLLSPRHNFLESFLTFFGKLKWRGIVNSLSQLVIKCCAPGMPDIYRGTELWDLSLVDPDNRRAVDFPGLQESLEKITRLRNMNPLETIRDLYNNAPDGRIKQLLTSILLHERRSCPELFLHGNYIPLETTGKYGDNIMGFARKHKDQWLICILPLHSASLSSERKGEHFLSIKWRNTGIALPEGAPYRWENIITGQKVVAGDNIPASELFSDLPVAVLKARTELSRRKAGILLHISSLAGEYGTGDFGEEAYRFVDFLTLTSQTYWQTLPLSPVTKSQAWSPYSSPSAFAGNILFVSPRQLYAEGLVNKSDLDYPRFRNSNRVNHDKAGRFRDTLLKKAWDRLRKNTGHYLYRHYEKFCERESYWLDDYTLFLAFKEEYGNRNWSRWPSKVKNREEKTLKTAKYEFADRITLEKFRQFIFDRQWKQLKKYANSKGIQIFGDVPYYVNHDSADVWAHRQLFNINEKGKMKTVAGVPPDYFDSNGQLWNMPVYDWDRLRDSGYEWWISRLSRNLELFDLLRLDHFRAFSAFWEVPGGEKTAVKGQWSRGPGSEFFTALQERFPSMPFVAEDLGDIDKDVYNLRDEFGLPGMQVLQFSFDRDMAANIHTPHNHNINSLVYTGTHDNNTLRGWYEKELDNEGRKRLQEYAGKKIRPSESHLEPVRMAFASPAKIAIIPMQDYMGLGREARMNTPSTSRGNWVWKLKTPGFDREISKRINKLTSLYNRQ
ncbi:MAG: malto-oligosyltrehalose synthase [Bacteroidales bacterium]